MQRLISLSLFATLAVLAFCGPAASAPDARVALVIGNGGYDFAPLANPPNDARDMAGALKRCGFRVIEKRDCRRGEMSDAIREFGDRIKGGGVGLFYYAGHGVQVKGENYLVPVDARVEREYEIDGQCVKVSHVLGAMEYAGNRLNIVVLDACRDNPFKRSYRSTAQGLARMDAPAGTFIAYATAPDSIASDGTGENGLYTAQILRYMLTPDLTIEALFKEVRREVMQATGEQQVPWESSSLTGNFSFIATEQGRSIAVVPKSGSTPPAGQGRGYPPVALLVLLACAAAASVVAVLFFMRRSPAAPRTESRTGDSRPRDPEPRQNTTAPRPAASGSRQDATTGSRPRASAPDPEPSRPRPSPPPPPKAETRSTVQLRGFEPNGVWQRREKQFKALNLTIDKTRALAIIRTAEQRPNTSDTVTLYPRQSTLNRMADLKSKSSFTFNLVPKGITFAQVSRHDSQAVDRELNFTKAEYKELLDCYPCNINKPILG